MSITTDAIHGLQSPTSMTELSFLFGLRNVFRVFVSKHTACSCILYHKDKTKTFGGKNDSKMNSLKRRKKSHVPQPVLAFLNSFAHMTLDTDVCGVQMECALLQQYSGEITNRLNLRRDHQPTMSINKIQHE